MVDAILNSKLSLAKSKGIEVTAKAAVPSDMEISDVDLCVLIGNMLDNAIEACVMADNVQQSEFRGTFIRVYIGVRGKQLYVSVTNSVYTKINRQGIRFLSNKNTETHGYGLVRIDKICDKYHGFLNRNYEPGVFTTEILLPIYQ